MKVPDDILYLSPVMRVPHRRAVEAVAGLDRAGLGVLTVFIPQHQSAIAVSRGPVGTRHGADHQAHATCS